jgi:hypothetical protein
MTRWKIQDCMDRLVCYLCDLNHLRDIPASGGSIVLHLGEGIGEQRIPVCKSHRESHGSEQP